MIKPSATKIIWAAKFNTDWICFSRFTTRQWRSRNISLSSSARLWQRIRNCAEQSGTRVHCQSIGARPHLLAPCRMRQLGRTEWSQSLNIIFIIYFYFTSLVYDAFTSSHNSSERDLELITCSSPPLSILVTSETSTTLLPLVYNAVGS